MAPAGPVRAFLSYAHEDHAWRDRVLNQLGWLVNSGQLQAFDDRQIKPGEQWDPRIRAELEAASIIIVLISEHFVGSRFCTIEELVRAVERQRRGTADLIAIYCDWVDLEALPLAAHQVLPQDEKNDLKPLIAWGQKKASLPLSRIAAAVRGMVEARRAKSPEPAVAPPPANAPLGLPPRGRFLGRQTDLDQLRAWILDETRQPIAILGPGGIGKSKVALAALHDPEVAARFADRRLFVPLQDVRDEAGVYGAVARELGCEPGARPLAAVAAHLGPQAALIVLDNAETPWDADLAGAEQAFARFAELPQITLVLSLRGFEVPGVADWRPILLDPLPSDPSRELFLAIAGHRYAADPALPSLLRRLDGLPLAIELVAHRAQAEPDAATVLRQWDIERGRYPSRGEGGRKDLDLASSIALSLASPRMTEPGRRLFAALGRLPHGLARADLAAVMPKDGDGAAAALTRTGLILRGTRRLRMLAPVREHAARTQLSSSDQELIVAHYSRLADALPLRWTSVDNEPAAAHSLGELTNIEWSLECSSVEIDVDDLHRLAWRWIRVGDAQRALGRSLYAGEAYETARNIFATGLTPGDIRCDRFLGVGIAYGRIYYVLRARGKIADAMLAAEASHSWLHKLTDVRDGAAWAAQELSWSWGRRGEGHQLQGRFGEALDAYTICQKLRQGMAKSCQSSVQGRRDIAWAMGRVGEVLRDQGHLDVAKRISRRAHSIVHRLVLTTPNDDDLVHSLSVSFLRRGSIAYLSGDLRAALTFYAESAAIEEKLASSDITNAQPKADLAWALRNLGDAYLACDELQKAVDTFERSRKLLLSLCNADSDNAEWRRDLSVTFEKLAMACERQGDRAAALGNWRQALAISEGLAHLFSEIVDMRATPALHLAGIARNLDPADPSALGEACIHLERALALLGPLAAAGRLSAVRREWIPTIERQRAALGRS